MIYAKHVTTSLYLSLDYGLMVEFPTLLRLISQSLSVLLLLLQLRMLRAFHVYVGWHEKEMKTPMLESRKTRQDVLLMLA